MGLTPRECHIHGFKRQLDAMGQPCSLVKWAMKIVSLPSMDFWMIWITIIQYTRSIDPYKHKSIPTAPALAFIIGHGYCILGTQTQNYTNTNKWLLQMYTTSMVYTQEMIISYHISVLSCQIMQSSQIPASFHTWFLRSSESPWPKCPPGPGKKCAVLNLLMSGKASFEASVNRGSDPPNMLVLACFTWEVLVV